MQIHSWKSDKKTFRQLLRERTKSHEVLQMTYSVKTTEKYKTIDLNMLIVYIKTVYLS